MGNGSKRESPGLGSVFYTNAIPKLIKLDLRQSQVNTFCFSGKRIQSIAPPSFVVVQYLIICPAMNINLLFVGGASIFAKFLS